MSELICEFKTSWGAKRYEYKCDICGQTVLRYQRRKEGVKCTDCRAEANRERQKKYNVNMRIEQARREGWEAAIDEYKAKIKECCQYVGSCDYEDLDIIAEKLKEKILLKL